MRDFIRATKMTTAVMILFGCCSVLCAAETISPFKATFVLDSNPAAGRLVCQLQSAASGWELTKSCNWGNTVSQQARSAEDLVWKFDRREISSNVYELSYELTNEGASSIGIEQVALRMTGDKSLYSSTAPTGAWFWLVNGFQSFDLSKYYGLMFLHSADFVMGFNLIEGPELPGFQDPLGTHILDTVFGFNATSTSPWVLQTKSLAPGETRSWSARLAIWPRNGAQYQDDGVHRYVGFIPTRKQMEDMGWSFPAPDPDIRVRGHVVHCPKCAKGTVYEMAKPGTLIRVMGHRKQRIKETLLSIPIHPVIN